MMSFIITTLALIGLLNVIGLSAFLAFACWEMRK